jgi:hypothetical protein
VCILGNKSGTWYVGDRSVYILDNISVTNSSGIRDLDNM